jgi:GNAT superfamily N-acetyltransferase
MEEASQGELFNRAHYQEEVLFHFRGGRQAPELGSLLVSRTSGQPIGVCLVEIWDSWPLIVDLEMDPRFRGQGLATQIIQRTLGQAWRRYPVVRLFVTLGNPAQSFYRRLGFLPGVAVTQMQRPPQG